MVHYFLFEVNMLPKMNGKSILVKPNGLEIAIIVVRIRVAANPHNIKLSKFIFHLLLSKIH